MVEITCIICPNGCTLTVEREGDKWTVSGNLCGKEKVEFQPYFSE